MCLLTCEKTDCTSFNTCGAHCEMSAESASICQKNGFSLYVQKPLSVLRTPVFKRAITRYIESLRGFTRHHAPYIVACIVWLVVFVLSVNMYFAYRSLKSDTEKFVVDKMKEQKVEILKAVDDKLTMSPEGVANETR